MIDQVDTNEQGRVIISGFREYRNRGTAQGARFLPRCTELGERNHIISTFVIPTSAFVIGKMTCYKVIPRASRPCSLVKRFNKTNSVIKSTRRTAEPRPLNKQQAASGTDGAADGPRAQPRTHLRHFLCRNGTFSSSESSENQNGRFKRNSGVKRSDYD